VDGWVTFVMTGPVSDTPRGNAALWGLDPVAICGFWKKECPTSPVLVKSTWRIVPAAEAGTLN
jgi:hypothetical protein